MPNPAAKRADVQLRALMDALESSCLVCGADLVPVLCADGETRMLACPVDRHTRQETDAAFERMVEIALLTGEEEPPLASEGTAVLPTNRAARADIYRQRFKAGLAIFHPGADMNDSDRLARVVGHTDKGTFWRGGLAAQSGIEEDDDEDAIPTAEDADAIVIGQLAKRGIYMQSERFREVARAVGVDTEPPGSASHADAGGAPA